MVFVMRILFVSLYFHFIILTIYFVSFTTSVFSIRFFCLLFWYFTESSTHIFLILIFVFSVYKNEYA